MKPYRIEVHRNWHYDRFSFLTPGVYWVPHHISEQNAERVVSEGFGMRLDPFEKKAPENKVMMAPENKAPEAVLPVERADDGTLALSSSRPRGRPRGRKT